MSNTNTATATADDYDVDIMEVGDKVRLLIDGEGSRTGVVTEVDEVSYGHRFFTDSLWGGEIFEDHTNGEEYTLELLEWGCDTE